MKGGWCGWYACSRWSFWKEWVVCTLSLAMIVVPGAGGARVVVQGDVCGRAGGACVVLPGSFCDSGGWCAYVVWGDLRGRVG